MGKLKARMVIKNGKKKIIITNTCNGNNVEKEVTDLILGNNESD